MHPHIAAPLEAVPDETLHAGIWEAVIDQARHTNLVGLALMRSMWPIIPMAFASGILIGVGVAAWVHPAVVLGFAGGIVVVGIILRVIRQRRVRSLQAARPDPAILDALMAEKARRVRSGAMLH